MFHLSVGYSVSSRRQKLVIFGEASQYEPSGCLCKYDKKIVVKINNKIKSNSKGSNLYLTGQLISRLPYLLSMPLTPVDE